MTLPLVTVVIPCYNKSATVVRSIQSVKEQTLTNYECYVVDNNSTDGSLEVIKEAIKDDDRFKWAICKDQGVAHARNYGIALGSAPFVCCLDSDDAIAPQFLEACVLGLQANRSLGITYTGLYFIHPGGKEGLSTWPTEFEANKQMDGKNQIPTCCVFRREMWERLGGYRQRFADPQIGAGAEDGEFWLRATAYGWDAKKVTDAGLFIYSWMSGTVSGNKEYKQPDYLVVHPWSRNNPNPPFACLSTPTRTYSHPVRQYDQPDVSVIIPVGDGHEKVLVDALDSVENQTFLKWEVIVVWDSPQDYSTLKTAFPFARFVPTGGQRGAGYARNLGVRQARAQLLLFLDADDTLHTTALERILEAYAEQRGIIYSDYVGKAFISDELAEKMSAAGRLIERHKDGWAIIRYNSSEYDCEKAQHQPDTDLYIWNLITSLVPKTWHEEIGGFDEKMPSWEDWDYWIRMAQAGKCFVRLPEPLVAYRFYTGGRRERGLEEHKNLLQYMLNKYKDGDIVACSGCGKRAARPVVLAQKNPQPEAQNVSGGEFILARYNHPNTGRHLVYGPNLFKDRPSGVDSVKTGGGWRIKYGYRSGGDRFFVHRFDMNASPGLFTEIVAEKPIEPEPVKETPPPEILEEEETKPGVFDLADIPNITPIAAQTLNAMGVHTFEQLAQMSIEELTQIKGIGKNRARAILTYAQDNIKT